MTSQVTKTERGWPGHFICARSCRFHRNTLLERGQQRIVISTVGLFINSRDKLDTVGLDRHYETMAFYAKWDAPYWEIDIDKQIHFESPWFYLIPEPLEENTFGADSIVNDMHERVVDELVAKLAAGGRI